jgi:hypothetical protein
VNTPLPEIGGEGVAAVLVKPPPTSAHAYVSELAPDDVEPSRVTGSAERSSAWSGPASATGSGVDGSVTVIVTSSVSVPNGPVTVRAYVYVPALVIGGDAVGSGPSGLMKPPLPTSAHA